MDTRVCNKCGIEKVMSEFSPAWTAGRPGVFRRDCKVCNCKRVVAREMSNPIHRERKRQNARNWRKRIKDAVFAAYGGYVCACCGETEERFLQLDHINNDGNKWRTQIFGRSQVNGKSDASLVTYKWIIERKFPDGFQVLCANCNFGKRMNKGICPHREQSVTTRGKDLVESSDSKRPASVEPIH